MCMADYRISRWVRTTGAHYDLTAGQSVTIPPNKQRVGIQFSCTDTPGNIWMAIDKLAALGDMMLYTQNSGPLKFTFADDGDLPQRMFSISNVSMSNGNLYIIEHWLPESILERELQQLGG